MSPGKTTSQGQGPVNAPTSPAQRVLHFTDSNKTEYGIMMIFPLRSIFLMIMNRVHEMLLINLSNFTRISKKNII